jgi:hypothetical protein
VTTSTPFWLAWIVQYVNVHTAKFRAGAARGQLH